MHTRAGVDKWSEGFPGKDLGQRYTWVCISGAERQRQRKAWALCFRE